MKMCSSIISKQALDILIMSDSLQIVRSGTINLSTLSEATSTPVYLMCCESGILMVRMVLLPNGGVIRYSTIKHK